MKRALVVVGILVAAGWWMYSSAEAQIVPQQRGINLMLTAMSTPQQIPAQNANPPTTYGNMDCTVTMAAALTADAGTGVSTWLYPVCSGYQGITQKTCFAHICTNSARCSTPIFARTTVPDAIWYMAPDPHPDAGVPFLVELGAGCRAP